MGGGGRADFWMSSSVRSNRGRPLTSPALDIKTVTLPSNSSPNARISSGELTSTGWNSKPSLTRVEAQGGRRSTPTTLAPLERRAEVKADPRAPEEPVRRTVWDVQSKGGGEEERR